MKPIISIPQHWGYPRFALDQRTEQGTILGLYYYPSGTELAEQFDDGWRYVLMPNKTLTKYRTCKKIKSNRLHQKNYFTKSLLKLTFTNSK